MLRQPVKKVFLSVMSLLVIILLLTGACDMTKQDKCTNSAYPLSCEETDKCCPRGSPYYSSRTGYCYESYDVCVGKSECHVCSEQ